MNKNEFINLFYQKLDGLPKKEIDDRLNFYLEIIDDKIEEGKTEEQAILEIGNVEDIADEVLNDISVISIVKENIKPKKKFKLIHLILIILSFPIWLPVIITYLLLNYLMSMLFAIFIIVFWTIVFASAILSLSCLIIAFSSLFSANYLNFGLYISLALIFSGISILLYFLTKFLTKIFIKLLKLKLIKKRKTSKK